MRKYLGLLALALLLTSCTLSKGTVVQKSLPPEATTVSVTGQSLPLEQGRHFNGSGNCAICHTCLFDESGLDVSTLDLISIFKDTSYQVFATKNLCRRQKSWTEAISTKAVGLSEPHRSDVIVTYNRMETLQKRMIMIARLQEANGQRMRWIPDPPMESINTNQISNHFDSGLIIGLSYKYYCQSYFLSRVSVDRKQKL